MHEFGSGKHLKQWYNQTGPPPALGAGYGLNATNIKCCLALPHEAGFTSHLSIECEGQGGPLLPLSLEWLRETLAELGIPEEKE